MNFDESYIHQIRSSNDIKDVVGGYVRLKKSGQNEIGLCPFHNEKTPSFNVSASKQIFKCFGCQVGGDVIEFIRLIENLSFPEAIEHLAERQGIPLPADRAQSTKSTDTHRLLALMQVAQAHFRAFLLENSGAREYLVQRRIAADTIESFGLGYAPPGNRLLRLLREKAIPEAEALKCGLIKESPGGQPYDNFRDRIMVPIRDPAGRIIAFGGRSLGEGLPKYLNSPDTVLYKKSLHLFGLDLSKQHIRRRECAILVEGYFDCIVPFQAGFRNVVASLGTSLTDSQVKLLRRYTRQVILAYDSDEAGLRAALRCLRLLLEGGLRVNVVQLPEQVDPDTFINLHGAEAYRKQLIASQPGIEFALDYQISQHPDPFSPRGKQEIADAVSPLTTYIGNRIERSEYVSRVAARLQVEPDLILQQVRRFRTPNQVPSGVATTALSEARPAEVVLLHALMNPGLAPLLKPKVDSDLVATLATQRLFEKVFELWELNRQPSILNLRDALEDAGDVHLLETIGFHSAIEVESEEIALESIRSLRKMQLDRKKRQVQHQLKQEETKDPSSPLIVEFLRELQEIEHSRFQLDRDHEPA